MCLLGAGGLERAECKCCAICPRVESPLFLSPPAKMVAAKRSSSNNNKGKERRNNKGVAATTISQMSNLPLVRRRRRRPERVENVDRSRLAAAARANNNDCDDLGQGGQQQWKPLKRQEKTPPSRGQTLVTTSAAFFARAPLWLLLAATCALGQQLAGHSLNHHTHHVPLQNHSGAQILIASPAWPQTSATDQLAGGDHQLRLPLPSHFQPASVFQLAPTVQQQQQQQQANSSSKTAAIAATSGTITNFTHLLVDELTGSIYVGATNWLFQLASATLKPEIALRTGPTLAENSRDCAPTECLAPLAGVVDLDLVPAYHAHLVTDLWGVAGSNQSAGLGVSSRRLLHAGTTMHTSGAHNNHHGHHHHHLQPASALARRAGQAAGTSAAAASPLPLPSGAVSTQASVTPASAAAGSNNPQGGGDTARQRNNYNKIMAIDWETRQLLVCGSLNQGACRRHQLGQLGNMSDLIPLPVASNDEHSSSVALISSSSSSSSSDNLLQPQQQQQQRPVLYVAATNSRLGPYREMVPAISARYLEPAPRALQIIERSFTDSARVDISSELRDYYLVNYVHSFQHGNFLYFATVQRKSPLRQLEEWGYQTRLARLCLGDLSFQSYVEMTLECSAPASNQAPQSGKHSAQSINYNLLQDAHLTLAGSHLTHHLGLRPASGASRPAVLVGVFAQSRDHTTRSSQKSAVCLFPMDKIEQRFQENIQMCYNGTARSRNMNYIAGSVNDCPKQGGSAASNNNAAANFCNEPLKLNGSLALAGIPVATYDNELLTSITATLAPTSPLSLQALAGGGPQPTHQTRSQQPPASQRQHQVLVVGTNEGALKKIVLLPATNGELRGLEFDSIQVDETRQEPILADMHLLPSLQAPPTVAAADQQSSSSARHHHHHQQQQQQQQQQFVVAATAHKVVKLRLNSCKAPSLHGGRSGGKQRSIGQQAPGNQSTMALVSGQCQACAQLQDPFCGWCATAAACMTRDECLAAAATINTAAEPLASTTKSAANWQPFDAIKCADYEPIAPAFVPLQASDHQPLVVDVNVRLLAPSSQTQSEQQQRQAQPQRTPALSAAQLAANLAQAHFICHFDYLALTSSKSGDSQRLVGGGQRLAGATTKATQARLNLHARTVAIGCPLPPLAQRPHHLFQATDSVPIRLTVRLATPLSSGPSLSPLAGTADDIDSDNDEGTSAWWRHSRLLEQLLGLSSNGDNQPGQANTAPMAPAANNAQSPQDQQQQSQQQQQQQAVAVAAVPSQAIERELTMYDCSHHSDCRQCLEAPTARRRGWQCVWCPMSAKCTFNATHPDFGCAASAIASTTPHSVMAAGAPLLRGSQLSGSLDWAQASLLGVALDKQSQCPPAAQNNGGALGDTGESPHQFGSPALSGGSQIVITGGAANGEATLSGSETTSLTQAAAAGSGSGQLVEQAGKIGGAAGLKGGVSQQEILVPNLARRSIQVTLRQSIVAFVQQKVRVMKLECLLELEGAKARFPARLVDNMNVICQESQFGYQAELAQQRAHLHVILNDNQVIESTEVILYKCHLFGVNPPALTSSVGASGAALQYQSSAAAWRTRDYFFDLMQQQPANYQLEQLSGTSTKQPRRQSDCSLCANIERKYQCAWCANQCLFADQCPPSALPASNCPPPRITSIHPTSGPLEGGTLLTIEGSNLGANEREIQDKISVGGEPCQLVMYSVSTRIVCKTTASLLGPQAATVFVGNRAGVTSALEKFLYKAVHLTDVNPRVGPVSGGTRLYLTGSNLNIGSRTQIFLDDIPCTLDPPGGSSHELTGNQISCVTAPNLHASSHMRIQRLTLMVDNSSHYLPYPFTYQPDPIITSIEPAESFLSGGRLILVAGTHLASPQSSKLLVYHENKHNGILNGTSCITQNDTLITCLTPAISRDIITNLINSSSQTDGINQQQSATLSDPYDQQQQQQSTNGGAGGLSYESGGVKLKMMFVMDDVKSVRNLDDYYHHLPHYMAYYEDPQLFKLPQQVVNYSPLLTIAGNHLQMKQLDQDMLITIGAHVCPIKSIEATQVTCEPPAQIAPIFHDDPTGRLQERPLLPIVALVGSNLRYPIGYMQYEASQYISQTVSVAAAAAGGGGGGSSSGDTAPGRFFSTFVTGGGATTGTSNGGGLSSAIISSLLTLLAFLACLGAVFVFAVARLRQSKAKREYKRIQLQMGSLDVNGQPIGGLFSSAPGGGLFDKIHLGAAQANHNQHLSGRAQIIMPQTLISTNQHNHHLQQPLTTGRNAPQSPTQPQSMRERAMGYVGGALGGKKLLYQFSQQLPFPPNQLTDISSLIGSSPVSQHSNNHQRQQQQQQHFVKLATNGGVLNSVGAQRYPTQCSPHYEKASTSSSSQSSPGSVRNSNNLVANHHQNHQNTVDKSSPTNLLDVSGGGGQTVGNSRNFNWTQEAPSTIVPYAVIEACNLTLEGKNAIKEFV